MTLWAYFAAMFRSWLIIRTIILSCSAMARNNSDT